MLIPSLYLKIGGFVALVAAIYGGYSYVSNLREDNQELKRANEQVTNFNEALKEDLLEQHRMQEVRDEVSEVSQKIRNNNKNIKDNNSKVINESVVQGKDREVGPLLKDYFNATEY